MGSTAPNSGVSLEVGATYRDELGREVTPLVAEPDYDGLVPVRRRDNGRYIVVHVDVLRRRVAPTPADRWLTLHGEDTAWTLHDSQEEAEAYLADTSKVLRLARFTFAEWIDTEDATNG